MNFEITSGYIKKPIRVVVHGTEGIGKSTFASKFPKPVFIDTEGSTNHLDVARFPAPSSWEMLLKEVEQIIMNPQDFKTLVIDTADWAQTLCIQSVCARKNVSGIEDFGYGQGYSYVKEEFGKFLNRLNDVIDRGLNVVLLAHSIINKFTKPEEMGQFDRYELKLINSPKCSISALVKEWSDLLLFANYETFLVEDAATKKKYASGNKRVMYTTHAATHDAKNRFGMPEKLPFDFDEIKKIFDDIPVTKTTIQTLEQTLQSNIVETVSSQKEVKNDDYTKEELQIIDTLPKSFKDLMIASKVKPVELANVIAAKGFFPIDKAINTYPLEFYTTFLVPNWSKVLEAINEERKLPF